MLKNGHSEVLVQMAKNMKYQWLCEGVLSQATDSYLSLFKCNGLHVYHEGIVEVASSVVELSKERVIEVDVGKKELLRVNGEIVNGIEHNRVLNLSDEGERWEGDIMNEKPYGWGVLYDSENRMVYEGFRMGDVNVCYGTQYYSNIHKVESEGEWFEGKRWGRGSLCDRNGNTMLEGEWLDDEHVEKTATITAESTLLPSCIEELTLGNGSFSGEEWNCLDLSLLPHLRELRIGDYCCRCVEEVKWVGMHALERVVIGVQSFIVSEGESKVDRKHPFYLRDCERLRELKIGRWSFSGYSACELENLPSLEVIEMGESNRQSCCFYHASLELKSESFSSSIRDRLTQVEIRSVWRPYIS